MSNGHASVVVEDGYVTNVEGKKIATGSNISIAGFTGVDNVEIFRYWNEDSYEGFDNHDDGKIVTLPDEIFRLIDNIMIKFIVKF